MNAVIGIVRRELRSYFVTPLAWTFGVIFLVLAGVCTFYLGHFYARGQADLQPFFVYHPWLYLLLVPGLTMQMWAEERKRGTMELLLTLPITTTQAVLGKFFAAWVLVACVLVLTFPIWWTVNYLGHPDNGIIVAGYVGSLLMAGAYIAVGCCLSTLTRSQVVAFILTVAVCLLLLLAGQPVVMDAVAVALPPGVVHVVGDFSFLQHFAAIARGVLDVRDVFYFVASIVFWLAASVILLDLRRAK